MVSGIAGVDGTTERPIASWVAWTIDIGGRLPAGAQACASWWLSLRVADDGTGAKEHLGDLLVAECCRCSVLG